MGFFKSKDHLFAYFEKQTIERKFLNILKTTKVKNIEFIRKDEYDNNERYQTNYHSIDFNFAINKKDVRFKCQKINIKNIEDFNKRYHSWGVDVYSDHNKKKINKGGDNYIGLPDVDSGLNHLPHIILEINARIFTKESSELIYESEEYMSFLNLGSDWYKDVERDFNKISDKIIRETLKNIK